MSDLNDHIPPTVERHCDVAVIGGSAAGPSAALQLGRQHRSVIVVDTGEPRHARALHKHGYLGYEGRSPSDLLAAGREEVRSYGGEVLAGRASQITRTEDDHFRGELVGGHVIVARRVLASTGLVDELPDIEGLAEHWDATSSTVRFVTATRSAIGTLFRSLLTPRGSTPPDCSAN